MPDDEQSEAQDEQQQQQQSLHPQQQSQPLTAASKSRQRRQRSKRKVEKDTAASAPSASGEAVESLPQLLSALALSPSSPPSASASASASPSAARDADLLPGGCADVRLCFSPSRGRHLLASAALPVSHLVLTDRGYGSVVKYAQRAAVCALCHQSKDGSTDSAAAPPAFLSCTGCAVASYCSARCQQAALAARHGLECELLSAVGAVSAAESVDVDLLQLLVAVIARRHRELHRDAFPVAGAPTLANEQLTDEQRWRDDELRLEHVLDLSHHPQLFSSRWRSSVLRACASLLRRFSASPCVLTAEQLLEVAMRINCNSHGVVDFSGNSSVVGVGLYCRLSLLNHSCLPNAHYAASRCGLMTVRTTRQLRAGEELTLHYCDLYDTREERGRQLQREKGFTCSCDRCAADITSVDSSDRLVGGVYCACDAGKKQQEQQQQQQQSAGDRLSRSSVSAGMAVAADAALLLFVGDAGRAADDQRRDYQCTRCGRKASSRQLSSCLEPLLSLFQSASALRQAGRGQAAVEALEALLSLNRRQRIASSFHPLLLSAYVLLFNLCMQLQRWQPALLYSRHVVQAYRTVFPPVFDETANWLYAEGMAADRLWQQALAAGSRLGRQASRRWKEERNAALRECWAMRDVCHGGQFLRLSHHLSVLD